MGVCLVLEYGGRGAQQQNGGLQRQEPAGVGARRSLLISVHPTTVPLSTVIGAGEMRDAEVTTDGEGGRLYSQIGAVLVSREDLH